MDLINTLAPLSRLALAYAPLATRERWLTLLALDARLEAVVRQAREPLLAQMKLAWWRDRLAQAPQEWPRGEPLLAALACWDGGHGALVGLVDGWEAVLGDADLTALGEGRAAACVALGGDEVAARMARGWALADLAPHLQDREALAAAMAAQDWRGGRLARGLRPLSILHAIAVRAQGDPAKLQKISILTLMRLGLFGI